MAKNLRDFGFGKKSMEALLSHEVEKFVNYMKPSVGKKFDLDGSLNVSILNALWVILTGETRDLDDPNLKSIVNLVNQIVGTSSPQSSLLGLLPNSIQRKPSKIYWIWPS